MVEARSRAGDTVEGRAGRGQLRGHDKGRERIDWSKLERRMDDEMARRARRKSVHGGWISRCLDEGKSRC